MFNFKQAGLSACFLLLSQLLSAQVSPNEVGPGTALRKTLLNTIRTPTEAELGQKVEFMVDAVLAKGNWAFASGQLQQPGGKALDIALFKDKDYREMAKEGLFDRNFQALLQKKQGKWVIVKRALGCTDVCWLDWKSIKGVPEDIFPQ